MAYTGAGTQADPYIVTALTDLVALATSSDVYIKICGNINASNETAFSETYYSTITLSGHIYADTMTTISNAIIQASNMISFSSAVVTNIFFKNWIHKKNSTDASIYGEGSTVADCCFSFEMIDNDKSPKTIGGNGTSTMERCAAYVKYTSGTTRRYTSSYMVLLENWAFKKCTFQLENLLMGTLRLSEGGSFDHCTFVGNAETMASSQMIMLVDSSQIIFALNVTLAPESADSAFSLIFGNTSYSRTMSGILVDTDIIGDTNKPGYISFASYCTDCYQLTTSQIQSEQYLTDIGFLP